MEGVERVLQRGRRLGLLGRLSAVLGLAQAIAALANAGASLELGRLADQWPLWSGAAFLVIAGVLVNWTRFWVRVSRSPFRYTYSVAAFEPVGDGVAERGLLDWLERDLAESLSRRIPRLSRLDAPEPAEKAEAPQAPDGRERVSQDRSHIHIAASYGVRARRDGTSVLEVTPWVRMGTPHAPSTLAHPVRFRLRDAARPSADVDAYESVSERIYFSVATAIYARIEHDVQQKIELLPGARFRAAAYFHEAEDYVRSNTLDAYDKAGALYRAVIEIHDPEWRPTSAGAWRRSSESVLRLRVRAARRARVCAARIWPALAGVQLTAARAHLGYANTLLFRRILASLSGQRINPVFETRRGIERAIELLRALPKDVEGRRDVLFNAYVTAALAATQLRADSQARAWLARAKALQPARAERNARCLFVRGLLQPQPRPRAQLLRQAVEGDPEFEVALFELAKTLELVWRTRPTFEKNVAQMVFEEYDNVLRLNPGNVVAWANVGYMHWLLRQPERAREAYERGRQYKEIKRETFVAQLDYGLARIAAEEPSGRFADAYRHYLDGVTAHIASGVSHDPGYSDYQFELIGGPMIKRFEQYLARVRRRHPRSDPRDPTTGRERDSVLAFVLNDYGEACVNYYLRFGDPDYWQKALAAFKEACAMSPAFLLPHYNLHGLPGTEEDRSGELDRAAAIERVYAHEPNWVDAMLELVAERAAQIRHHAARVRQDAADRVPELRQRAAELRARAQKLRSYAQHAPERARAERAEADVRAGERGEPRRGESVRVVDVVQQRAGGGGGNGGATDPTAGARGGRLAHGAVERAIAERARNAERGRGPTALGLLEAEADRLEEEVESLLTEASRLESSERRQDPVAELLERLLPQDWLWRQPDTHPRRPARGALGRLARRPAPTAGADAQARVLDLSTLERRDYDRALRWERELGEVHVRALHAWCNTPAAEPAAAERVLRHILERYWPADFAVLGDYRRRLVESDPDGEKAREASARLLAIVDDWLEGDPEFWKLTWLVSDLDLPPEQRMLRPHEAAQRLRKASERLEQRVAEGLRREREAGDPDHIHLQVGDWLNLLGQDRDAVLAVYRRAARSRRPEIQRELGSRFEQQESSREAIAAYAAAAEAATDDAGRKRCVGGVVRGLLALDEYGRAIAELELLARQAVEDGRWRSELVAELAERLSSRAAYAELAEWLERSKAGGQEARRDASAALIELAGRRYDQLVRAPEAHRTGVMRELATGTTPLLLETDPAFFAESADTSAIEALYRELREACERVTAETRIPIPMVRIRVNPTLRDGRYFILVHEAPVAAGRLDPGARSFHPALVEHVERAVRDHLADFAGTQVIHELLADWGGQAASDPLERMLRGASGRLRFVQTIQALVRDRVSLADLDAIVAAFAVGEGVNGPAEAAERLRAGLPPEALGLGARSNPIAVPAALEAAVAERVRGGDGQAFLALPSLQADELRARLRELTAGVADPVLVVREPRLRPLLRRLVEREQPALAVLARSELGGQRGLRRVRALAP